MSKTNCQLILKCGRILLLYWYLGEGLNFSSLIFQFYLVDIFLNNKFRWFGWEVLEYYSWSFRDRQNRDLMLR